MQWAQALELLRVMRQDLVAPDTITFSGLITACERGMQWEWALQLLCEMPQDRIEPDIVTFSAAISACGKGVQWEHSSELLCEMRQEKVAPDMIAYSTAITAFEGGVQWESRGQQRHSKREFSTDMTRGNAYASPTSTAASIEHRGALMVLALTCDNMLIKHNTWIIKGGHIYSPRLPKTPLIRIYKRGR